MASGAGAGPPRTRLLVGGFDRARSSRRFAALAAVSTEPMAATASAGPPWIRRDAEGRAQAADSGRSRGMRARDSADALENARDRAVGRAREGGGEGGGGGRGKPSGPPIRGAFRDASAPACGVSAFSPGERKGRLPADGGKRARPAGMFPSRTDQRGCSQPLCSRPLDGNDRARARQRRGCASRKGACARAFARARVGARG